MEVLRLIPDSGEIVELQLNTDKSIYTLEKVLLSDKKVYGDIDYKFEFADVPEDAELTIYFNDDLKQHYFSDGYIEIKNKKVRGERLKTFGDRIGFLQIRLCLESDSGENVNFYSEYVSLLVRPNRDNQAITSILNYIYANQQDILYQKTQSILVGNNYQKSHDDFWSQIIILEEIIKVYESKFGYFKANCRTKLTECEVVDRTDKLQYVDGRTVRYITQHPEFLRKDARGIEVGNQRFLPTKTLMIQNKITYDIYENKVVLAFLKRVCNDVSDIKLQMEEYYNSITINEDVEDGYILSSQILYQNALDTLRTFLDRIKIISDKVEYLYLSYKRILDVSEIELISMPKPTAIFMSIPQYNQIYVCMHSWFSKTGYDFENERHMLRFFDAPSVYESYVLLKLIEMIKAYGFVLESSKKVTYPVITDPRFVASDYNNTFVFKEGAITLTLYYEPVIYDYDSYSINQIGLYRNNSVPYQCGENYVDPEVSAYTPDYVLKAEKDGVERYIISDAKYKEYKIVRNRDASELSYKYLFSIDPIETKGAVKGLALIYGKPDEENSVESFFNREIPGTRTDEPFVTLVPMTEDVPYNTQRQMVFEMLRSLLKDLE